MVQVNAVDWAERTPVHWACLVDACSHPTLEEIQQKFMGDAAADEDNDRLRLFVLRREYVIELAKKAMDAKAEGIEPDPLPVFQVS